MFGPLGEVRALGVGVKTEWSGWVAVCSWIGLSGEGGDTAVEESTGVCERGVCAGDMSNKGVCVWMACVACVCSGVCVACVCESRGVSVSVSGHCDSLSVIVVLVVVVTSRG